MSAKKQPKKTPAHNPEPEPAAPVANQAENWDPKTGAAGFIRTMLTEGYAFDIGGDEHEPTWVFTMERQLENEHVVDETVVVSFCAPITPTVEHSFERRLTRQHLETVKITLRTPISHFVRDPEESRDRLERMWIGGAEE